MNFSKLDTALILALRNTQDQSKPCLVVFIHTQSAIDSAAIAVLEGFGVSGITAKRDVFTATVSPNAVSQLSEQPWVKYLRLSQELRLVSGD
ncbi:hypothetical protein Riv7116_2807 [Rivularia sp. PCC 7116]|uniref:hypothetical protein n=1 Tax=Rivularia sp. PCC 7116 TaxID=373994 RepID=UPI00029F2DAE|nr:hypothetical protein [Rivularia sp. PCC 7116]AFY55306.1 hypothetical protein Riv7116_2807 [Rivularia sp. PCC 7116]